MNEIEQRRPYAAAANVISVLERARTRNLPEVIDDEFMRIAGIGEAVYGRVRYALQFLNLINAEGVPTETLRAISRAPETEYRELLTTAVQAAYASDFVTVNPALDTQGQIIDAFRKYEPRSQTGRMVMLFLGLCREAGISVKDAPRERKQQVATARGTSTRTSTAKSPRGRATARGATTATPTPPVAPTGQQLAGLLLFGVTEDDIGVLDDNEFNSVWSALGVVARARARAKERASITAAVVESESDSESDDDEGTNDE